MDLIITPRSETNLIICPYYNSNIARFILGVNNSTQNFEKLPNILKRKVLINGSVHILLIASKDIEKKWNLVL